MLPYPLSASPLFLNREIIFDKNGSREWGFLKKNMYGKPKEGGQKTCMGHREIRFDY